MKTSSFFAILCMFLLVILSACSERALVDTARDNSFMPELASSETSTTETYYLVAVDWDGVTALEPRVFYRTDKIAALKSIFAADAKLTGWLNNLSQKKKVKSTGNSAIASAVEPEVLKVTVTSGSSQESKGPVLAALTWSATSTITPINGGATASCSVHTTNPSGVTGFISHQIWVYNQNGYVYYADHWSTEDEQEHAVDFTYSRSVDCDSTVKSLGRVLLEGNYKAWEVDTYVRSCN